MSEQDPLLRVVRGTPTAEEVAALVGAILAQPRPDAPIAPPTGSTWVRTARPGAATLSGTPSRPSAEAWRVSGLPR